MEFDTSSFDKYLVDLANNHMLPLFQWMLTGLALLLAFVYAGKTILRFQRSFAFQGGSSMDIRDRRNTVRSIFSSLFLTGAFGAAGKMTQIFSSTFTIRDNTAFTIGEGGINANLNSGMDAILLILAGMGIYAYFRCAFAFDSAMKGDQTASKEILPLLIAGIILTNMEEVGNIIKDTFNIVI